MNVGYIQYEVTFGDKEANMNAIRALVPQVQDASLIVLPELGLTGYDFLDPTEVRKFAEPAFDGPTTEFLRELTRATRAAVVIGYPECDGDTLYNSCMLLNPDGSKQNYRKIHLFSRETTLFTPGPAAPPVIDTPAGRVGLMICFDWFFPETARLLALQGAQIIAHPSNLVLQYCQRAMFARSVENHVYTITANRIGTENRADRSLRFTGASQVVSPTGETLVSAPDDAAHVGIVSINANEANDKQINEFNHLQHDRRVELYGDLI